MATLDKLGATQQESKLGATDTTAPNNRTGTTTAKAVGLSNAINSIMKTTSSIAGGMRADAEAEANDEQKLNTDMAQRIAISKSVELNKYKNGLELAVTKGEITRGEATKQLGDYNVKNILTAEHGLSEEAKDEFNRLYTTPSLKQVNNQSTQWGIDQHKIDQKEVITHTEQIVDEMGGNLTPEQISALEHGLDSMKLDNGWVESRAFDVAYKSANAEYATNPDKYIDKNQQDLLVDKHYGSFANTDNPQLTTKISGVRGKLKDIGVARARANQTRYDTGFKDQAYDSITRNPSDLNIKNTKERTIADSTLSGTTKKTLVAYYNALLGKTSGGVSTQTATDAISFMNDLLTINTKGTSQSTTGQINKVKSSDFEGLYSNTKAIINEAYKDRPLKREAELSKLEKKLISTSVSINETDAYYETGAKTGKPYSGSNEGAKQIIKQRQEASIQQLTGSYFSAIRAKDGIAAKKSLSDLGTTVSSYGGIPTSVVDGFENGIRTNNPQAVLTYTHILTALSNENKAVTSMIARDPKLSSLMEATKAYTKADGSLDIERLSPLLEVLDKDKNFISDKQKEIKNSIDSKIRNSYSTDLIDAVTSRLSYDMAFSGKSTEEQGVMMQEKIDSLTVTTYNETRVLDINNQYNSKDIDTMVEYIAFTTPHYADASKFYMEVEPTSGATVMKYDGVAIASTSNEKEFKRLFNELAMAQKFVADEAKADRLSGFNKETKVAEVSLKSIGNWVREDWHKTNKEAIDALGEVGKGYLRFFEFIETGE